ncbi:TonB-dependent receptor [Alteromonas sp. CYL-A6]|uniref:TonB-dependent receptor n=1 Tax=Alteromonas nitratireducens TaxID=3390813 RepID=UPI0034B05D88
MNKTPFTLSLCAIALGAVAQARATQAQTDTSDIEKITVTGDFRQSALDQLSASATVINTTRLLTRQGTHIDSALGIAPNVNVSTGASRGRFIQIRGIGERSQFAEPVNPSVSFLVDDFDFSGLAAAALMFDTRQLEVFRGPQATLFGTGALAGAIKLSSYAPGEGGPSYLEGRVATQNSVRLEGAHGDAVTENWDYRVAFMHNQSDGFMHNSYLNRDDTNGQDESAVRLAVKGQADTNTTLYLNYRFYDIDNGYDAFSLDNTRETLSDQPGFDRHRIHAVSLKTITHTDGGDLTVIASHAAHSIGYGYDEDWTYTGFHPLGYTSFDAYYRDISTQIGEIRFSSNDASALFGGKMDWLIGALYKTSEEDLLRQYTYSPADFASTYRPDTRAAYAITTTRLTERLSIDAGLRLESYDFRYDDNNGLDRSRDTTMVGGKFAVNYQTAARLWYASVSRGYKGAGFNPDQRVSEASRFFDEEYNWNYELGVKGALFSPDLMMRAALFYMDRTDTQVSDFDVLSRDNGSVEFIDIIDNADRGINQGAELELSWQATDSLRLNAAIGYLDATFEGYTAADGTEVQKRDAAQAPNVTANLFGELALSDHWYWRLDVDYKDRYLFSDGHNVMAPSATLVNTQLEWVNENWVATLWIRNAFDRTYYTRGFGGFSNDPRDAYAFDEPYYQTGDGRQTGITVRYEF